MSKSMVDRLFIGAIVAVIAGWVVAIVAMIAALAGGAVVIGGPTVVTVNGEAFASALLALAFAALLVGGGTIAGVASWIGALFNTARPTTRRGSSCCSSWGSGASASSRWLPTSSPGRTAQIAMPRVPAWQPLPARQGRDGSCPGHARRKEEPVMAQWRKATWVLVIWNVLMLLWLASTLQGEFSCVQELVPLGRSAT